MTIRKRLNFGFLAILGLFGVNLGFYFWGNLQRNRAVEELQKSAQRHAAVIDIRRDIELRAKEMGLYFETAAEGLSAENIRDLRTRLDQIGARIDKLYRDDPDHFDPLRLQFEHLSESWLIIFENLGVDQTRAITEQALTEGPLRMQVLSVILPRLEAFEEQREVDAARSFHELESLMNRLAAATFGLSSVLAAVVALWLSRSMGRGISALAEGAHKLGAGELDHRIAIRSRDELADLAEQFNAMAANLLSAQGELKAKNEVLAGINFQIERQKKVADELLLNILPAQVAEELQTRGSVSPKYFEDVTVLFTDFKGFTLSTEHLAAEELVEELHEYFTAFDHIVERYGLEKMKTIGDSYMCVGGLPERRPSHAVDTVLAGFEMLHEVQKRLASGLPFPWHVRIGIHTGPVIAGVVGIRKFAFDIWGETVNFASRMESGGEPGRVNVSERTYSRVKDFIDAEYRGKVRTKEGKDVDMYFALGIRSGLLESGGDGLPEAFRRRYSVYFQKEPPPMAPFLYRSPDDVSGTVRNFPPRATSI